MSCDGQEAADVGSAFALRAGSDLVVPYARDLGAMLTLGLTPQQVMLHLLARADDLINLAEAAPLPEPESALERVYAP